MRKLLILCGFLSFFQATNILAMTDDKSQDTTEIAKYGLTFLDNVFRVLDMDGDIVVTPVVSFLQEILTAKKVIINGEERDAQEEYAQLVEYFKNTESINSIDSFNQKFNDFEVCKEDMSQEEQSEWLTLLRELIPSSLFE